MQSEGLQAPWTEVFVNAPGPVGVKLVLRSLLTGTMPNVLDFP